MDDAPDGPTSEADKDRELAELLQQGLEEELAEISPEELAKTRGVYEYWETSFGTKVRQWRQARNWSQEDLADRLRLQGFDMHQTTVAKIERGTRPLRVAEAAAIANIFRVPPLAVFMGRPREASLVHAEHARNARVRRTNPGLHERADGGERQPIHRAAGTRV